jgi:hypothetical protein
VVLFSFKERQYMKKGLTKIVFVIDRSGSMVTVASDMIGGFNMFIKTQKANNVGECRVSFNQFDDVYEEVYKNLEIKDVPDLTNKTFVPRNSTALYDGIGRTINNVGDELSKMAEDDRPEKVLVVILTDGQENASREFNCSKVKDMIKHQTDVYKWEFVYIGANQDSWDVGQSMGIGGSNTINYVSNGCNATSSSWAVWDTLSNKTVNYRSCVSANMAFSDAEQDQQNNFVKTNKI